MTRRAGRFTFETDALGGHSRRTLLVAVAILALAGMMAFWYFNPQSQPSLISEYLPSSPSARVTLYRWRDESGQWVVSDQPPPDGVAFEEVQVRQDANVLPGAEDD